MTGESRPALRVVDGTGTEDPVARRRRFEEAHPDVTISPPETHASLWTARQDGKILASGYQLGHLLDALGWLTGEEP
jgi:hypothetical protein